jgi:hypothetical protein
MTAVWDRRVSLLDDAYRRQATLTDDELANQLAMTDEMAQKLAGDFQALGVPECAM